MAIIKGPFKIKGSIKGFSFYSVAGSDKVIMRTKGGPDPKKMKTDPKFAKVRLHQQEWAGAMKFSEGIHYALGETYRLSDFNVSATWCGLGKKMIGMDPSPVPGERPLMLSLYRDGLENFSLNKKFPFNSVLRITPQFEINKEEYQATVKIPTINTEMDLFNIQKLPYFRVLVSLGIVSDIIYRQDISDNRGIFKYIPELGDLNGYSLSNISDWFSTNDLIKVQTYTVKLDNTDIEVNTDNLTFLLGIGMEFGKVGLGKKITPVKHAGCGKILSIE